MYVNESDKTNFVQVHECPKSQKNCVQHFFDFYKILKILKNYYQIQEHCFILNKEKMLTDNATVKS